MSGPGNLASGREAFERQEWTAAFARLAAADAIRPLEAADLERLATAAHLIGRDSESEQAWARAHQERLRLGEVERAARCAFWLAFALFENGESARGSAWIERARRLLDRSPRECVEQGYVLLPLALSKLFAGDVTGAHEAFSRSSEIAERFGDPDLVALSRHSLGRVLLRMGRIREGVRLLDEAMVAVEAGEVSPLVIGDVYCSVIEGCLEIFDLPRAREWTSALARWCDAQPDLVPFSGQCLLRRAEILELHGEWEEAQEAARRACERLLRPVSRPASGAALYRRGELHRLRGDESEAESSFREASRNGKLPQPGLALLRLAQGRTRAAWKSIRLALDGAASPAARARLLPAFVEVGIAAGEAETALAAAEELTAIADEIGSPLLDASARQARGAVLLARGDPRAAHSALRAAWSIWQELGAPYNAARARVLIALACGELGDREAAEMELDAARWAFQRLGASADLAGVEAIARSPRGAPGRLSRRELEVLRLVAAGGTNRAIAAELRISERTVERHLSNIFTKLDVSSRTAATRYAFEHRLL
ncbi:MAG TPA: LuxR C-terminal-related transcriptional regulator [Thermoanaerobaculia bacterium]|nr:LuxR C-terminal-related transcriptional regulator [Thermoanaerobaculia bacterium]